MHTGQAGNVQSLMEAGDFPAAASALADQLAALDTAHENHRPAPDEATPNVGSQANSVSEAARNETKLQRIEALYLSAVCARYQNDHATARRFVQELFDIEPFFGRGFLEEAHICRAEGKAREALSNYQRASESNPAILAAWREQIKILDASDQPGMSVHARGELSYYESLPEPVLRAQHFLNEGRLRKAENLVKDFLLDAPRHVDAMRLLADISGRVGAYDEAEYLLESAMKFAPDNRRLMKDYILLMRKQQKFAKSSAMCTKLVALDPDDAGALFQQTIEHMQHGQNQAAIDGIDALLVSEPDNPAFLILRGHIEKALGHQDAAIAAYRRAIAVRNDTGQAFYALANLKTYTFSDDEIIVMKALLDDGRCALDERIHLNFALAAAYEKIGDTDRAFFHYDEGNRLKKAQSRYTSAVMHEELQRQQEFCTPALFAPQHGKGCTAPDPIFIVGLPRAGSTLIEQILASHSQIDGTLELPNILSLSRSLQNAARKAKADAYPANLHTLSAEDLSAYGRAYIEDTRMHRQGAAFFTDKMPNNFRHIGLISLILPNAKIIDARRDPMDCCFSGFKQLFAQGQEFTYGLSEIGHYYADYVSLMNHWQRALPGKILHVQHEDVLDDLEGQVRRMLDYLGLPFEPACLDFHTTERAVRTASSSQVRQPLNRKGIGAWRPFEKHLEPLKIALGEHYRAEYYSG
jgi:tetratricopeptide (TPR) repeat protein